MSVPPSTASTGFTMSVSEAKQTERKANAVLVQQGVIVCSTRQTQVQHKAVEDLYRLL